jgi:hypothetical protein
MDSLLGIANTSRTRNCPSHVKNEHEELLCLLISNCVAESSRRPALLALNRHSDHIDIISLSADMMQRLPNGAALQGCM